MKRLSLAIIFAYCTLAVAAQVSEWTTKGHA